MMKFKIEKSENWVKQWAFFSELDKGTVFRCNQTYYYKTSTRTARLSENDRVFYFLANTRVLP